MHQADQPCSVADTKTVQCLVREVTAKIYEAEGESPERDPIKIYEIYSIKCPNNFSNADDPFYLAPRTIPLEDSKTNIWFLRLKVGERKLAGLMKKNERKWQIRH